MTSNVAFRIPGWFIPVAGVLVGVLGVSLGVVPAAQADPGGSDQGVVDPGAGNGAGEVAGDAVSASVNARLLGTKVEVLGSRTESSSTFALPDGSWETVLATGPVWVRVGGDGSALEDWVAFDATLIPGEAGWFTARAHANKVSIVGGGAVATRHRWCLRA